MLTQYKRALYNVCSIYNDYVKLHEHRYSEELKQSLILGYQLYTFPDVSFGDGTPAVAAMMRCNLFAASFLDIYHKAARTNDHLATRLGEVYKYILHGAQFMNVDLNSVRQRLIAEENLRVHGTDESFTAEKVDSRLEDYQAHLDFLGTSLVDLMRADPQEHQLDLDVTDQKLFKEFVGVIHHQYLTQVVPQLKAHVDQNKNHVAATQIERAARVFRQEIIGLQTGGRYPSDQKGAIAGYDLERQIKMLLYKTNHHPNGAEIPELSNRYTLKGHLMESENIWKTANQVVMVLLNQLIHVMSVDALCRVYEDKVSTFNFVSGQPVEEQPEGFVNAI